MRTAAIKFTVSVVFTACAPMVASFSACSHKVSAQRGSQLWASSGIVDTLAEAQVIDPKTGQSQGCLDGLACSPSFDPTNLFRSKNAKSLIVISPQLGDFDTFEYAELLNACLPELQAADIDLRFIGIGDQASAKRFSKFSGLPLECIRVDPSGMIHRALRLHGGPDWDIPSFIPEGVLRWFKEYTGAATDSDDVLVARAWLNYMAMCAGIAAPKTLPEIIRGYLGDKSAPERLGADDVVTVGYNAIVIKGTTDVKLGPIEYQSLWRNQKGYLRPAELATVRLRGMVECLENFDEYVPDQTHVHLRGATFLFDANGNILYEHRDTGVLSYSKTMPRPLTFLKEYIGDKALNPLGLGDPR